MAHLEVETKIRIRNKDVHRVRERIKKIARFEKKEKRGDDYFAIQVNGYPKKAFRVRDNKKVFVINFKKWKKNLWSNDIVVKEEFEFEIKNKKYFKHFLALMRDLGFKEWIKKRKTCESYIYKKDSRVCIEINKVEHLGYFIEIEYLAKRSEVDKAKKIIHEVLKQLKIKQEQIDNTGYTRMLYNKGIKDKKYFIEE